MIRDKLPKCRLKKCVGLLGVVAVLVMACPVPVAAIGVVVSIPDAGAEFCNTVVVPVSIDNVVAPGLGGATIDLEYDNSVVEITNVADGDVMGVGYTPLAAANLAGKITLVWFYMAMPPGPTGDLLFANITLHALGSAGETSDLDLTVTSLYDAFPALIIPAVVDGVFTVLGEAIPPTVVDKSPTGSNVPIDTLVTATFSEAMDPATIDETSFTLAGSPVSGTVSYDAGTFKATFTPDADLDYSHEYTATLSTDITDLADNSLAAPYSWSFTTVKPAGWGDCGPIDLVIVLDDTGSMGDAITNIKTELPEIIEDAQIASAGDLRMGYITFKDNVTVRNALTDNLAAVQASIDATSAGGGAGTPEASDEAKNTAVNNLAGGTRDDSAGHSGTQIGDFTEAYRDDALKIVVLITDAPPGGFNDVWDTEDTEAMHTHALTAKDKDILISDIYVPTGGVNAAVAALLRDDAETSGGIYTEAESSGAGVGDAIKDIIASCGARLDAEFSGTPRRGAASLRVRFTDESTGPVESWLWDFGDGRTSSQQNPTHVYPNPGTYDVSLEVSGAGDTDKETKVHYIVVLAPEAVAAVAPEPARIGASYLYISPEQIVPGQWVEISANIYNRGGTKATHTVPLYINGYLAQSQTVGVSPGGTELVVFRVRADSEFLGGIYTGPGEYIANVEGMVGQFFVLAPAVAAPAGFGGPLGTGGIIAIVVVVIVLIVGLVFGLRRE